MAQWNFFIIIIFHWNLLDIVNPFELQTQSVYVHTPKVQQETALRYYSVIINITQIQILNDNYIQLLTVNKAVCP